jgi:hypothetical protein
MNSSLIQMEIEKKNQTSPYFTPPNWVMNLKTDMNVFPYTRYFRGKQNSYTPFIFDREAGYSPICYQIKNKTTSNQNLITANVCFQMPCSTILPCQNNSFQTNQNQCVYYTP